MRTLLLLAAISLVGHGAAAAEGIDTLVSGGKASLQLRYRLENVAQEGVDRDATAHTLRLRLNLTSGEAGGFSAVIEGDRLQALGDEAYNSTRNGHVSYPVVADPEGSDLNQAYLQFKGLPATVMRLGRQRITLDNQRFVGAVGWRQNEQTYDAFSIENKGLPNTTINYAYVDAVRRVFGPDAGSPTDKFEGDTHLVNVKYTGLPVGAVTAYGYFLDLDNAATLSSTTVGLRLDGSRKLGETATATWRAEYAKQADTGNNPVSIDADYWLLELGLKGAKVGAAIGVESLGGERGSFGSNQNPAFQTPLATLHGFQGWADKFLTTPAAGIEDRYVSVSGAHAGVAWQATWHDLAAEATSADYGTELDLSVSYKFAKRYEALAKFADYSTDGLFTDTSKFWLQVTATF